MIYNSYVDYKLQLTQILATFNESYIIGSNIYEKNDAKVGNTSIEVYQLPPTFFLAILYIN